PPRPRGGSIPDPGAGGTGITAAPRVRSWRRTWSTFPERRADDWGFKLRLDSHGRRAGTPPRTVGGRVYRRSALRSGRSAVRVADPVRAPGHRPGHRPLVAGDVARSAFDAVLVAEDQPSLDPLVAGGGADEGAERVRAAGADLRLDRDVRVVGGIGGHSQGAEPSLYVDELDRSGRCERHRRRHRLPSPHFGSFARMSRSARTAATLARNASRSAGRRSTSMIRSTPCRPSTTGTPTQTSFSPNSPERCAATGRSRCSS